MYLERLGALRLSNPDSAPAARLADTLARTLALWMSFEDTIRVADLKIRDARKHRVLAEVRARPGELVYITEFMKPRAEEIFGTMPAAIGRRLLASAGTRGFVERFTEGKQISTARVSGFLLLHALAGLRRFRRGTLRFAEEDAHITGWLALIQQIAPRDCERNRGMPDPCQRLRGNSRARLAQFRAHHERRASLDRSAGRRRQVRELRAAALADDQGIALAEAVRRVA